MNEAEEILQAMWDYNGSDFVTEDDYARSSCFFCAGRECHIVGMRYAFIHEVNCPAVRLVAFAAQRGWHK